MAEIMYSIVTDKAYELLRVSARVLYEGNPVEGDIVVFTLNGEEVAREVTDADGYAYTYISVPTEPKALTIRDEFYGQSLKTMVIDKMVTVGKVASLTPIEAPISYMLNEFLYFMIFMLMIRAVLG